MQVTPQRVLRLDGPAFAASFERREATTFRHELFSHPLLKVEAIADLADRLAAHSVVCDDAVKPLLVPGGGPPRGVVSRPGDLIRDLESSATWMTLLNIEQDQAYRDLIQECLEDLAPFAQRFAGDIRRPAGFIFVSSPNSVTPAHFDIEHSIPMQIQGRRTLGVGVFTTPDDKEREILRYWSGSHGRIEVMPIERATYDTEPGFGAYIPPLQPHWIMNGPSPSVSVTLTFFTRDTDQDSLVRAFNQHLINRGRRATPPGRSLIKDAAKVAVMRMMDMRHRIGYGSDGDDEG
jgi:hypothetical protein